VLNLEEIKKAIIEICEKEDCIYAILFGSVALGTAKEYSDIDIALKFKKNNDYINKTLRIMSNLSIKLNIDIDIIPLNIADTIIKYEIYSNGILLFCKDYNEYMDDYINAIDEYLDFEHIFNKFYERIVKEIKDAASRSQS
jgi:predicted nucleotidyltransferase